MVDRRQADGGATSDAPLETHRAGAAHLVVHDELVEVVLESKKTFVTNIYSFAIRETKISSHFHNFTPDSTT